MARLDLEILRTEVKQFAIYKALAKALILLEILKIIL